jgi:RNA polymerase sigma-70 factor, ECF subfamily
MVQKSPKDQSDGALMRRIADGDRVAFESVYDDYSAQAFSLAMRITGQQGAAEDVTQEAFLSLWRGAAGYEPSRSSLKGWLMLIVRSRGVDSIRRRTRTCLDVDMEDPRAEHLRADDSTDAEAIEHDESRHMRELLQGISGTQREVVMRTYFGELTQVEIASDLKLPLGTVKSRLRLAHTKLHRAITDELALAS